MFNIVSQNNEFTDWIHSDYVNLCMKNTPNSVNQPLVSCRNYPYYIPGLIENKLFRDFFFDNYKEVEFINLFEKAISNDYYVYLFLDEYYLKGKASYKTEHFSHDSLIYGVDSEKESIYIFIRTIIKGNWTSFKSNILNF
ncbi:hypothetical protein FACS1894193_01030 [Bacilli bacterium]|nr:hypothetical protein FACS1894193_01030 [Bacilli bacterium]